MAFIDQQDKKFLGLLLSPSWVSGLISVLVGLTLSLGVIGAYTFTSASFQQQLDVWQQNQPQKELTKPGEYVVADQKPKVKDSWPLLVIWAGVGLIVYLITAAIVHSLSSAAELSHSLGYVHANREKTIAITVGHIILRVIAMVALVAMIVIFYKRVIPYCITASHAAASDLLTLQGLLYSVLSFAMAALGIHLIVVFARMASGRPRLVGSN